MENASLGEHEFMTLAEGVGVIPEKFRNRAYAAKLHIAPGEGGLGNLLDSRAAATGQSDMRAFLAGVAAGANPQELAKGLLGDDNKSTTGRARRRPEGDA